MARIRTGLPFSTTTLLGLDEPNTDALVLDGLVMQLSNRRPRDGGAQVLVNRLPKAVQCCTPLPELFGQALRRHRKEIEWWVGRTHSNPGLKALPLPQLSADRVVAIERFVRKTLVPRLRREQDPSVLPATVSTTTGPQEDPVEVAIQSFPTAQIWSRWFAIYREVYYELAPFCGQPLSGRFHLTWKGRAYIAMSREKGRLAIRTCDERLEAAVSACFRDLPQPHQEVDLVYQAPPYSILRSASKHHFLCRRISPYVVEGQSRALYLFPSVQIGLPIFALEAEQVIGPLSAQVMHACRHMFAFSLGGGTAICMPQPPGYYEKLHQLPLEEALLQHLESARMTLCAGYHQGNKAAPFHNIGRLNMPRISLAEAQTLGLPVYRFYRR